MRFSAWLETALLKDFSGLINIGKVAWFDIYIDNKEIAQSQPESPSWTSVATSTHDKPQSQKELFEKVNRIAEKSAQMLSSLGFGRTKTILIISKIGMANPFTGGGTGGYFHSKKHGIVLGLSEVLNNEEHVVVKLLNHEVAHHYWKMMPKADKEVFNKWFHDNLVTAVTKYRQDWWKDVWQNKGRKEELYIGLWSFFEDWCEKKKNHAETALAMKNYLEYYGIFISYYTFMHFLEFEMQRFPDCKKMEMKDFFEMLDEFKIFDRQDAKLATDATKEKMTKPEGNFLRQIAQDLKISPSNYGAVNPGELWAETIAFLANQQKVAPNLKKLVVSLI